MRLFVFGLGYVGLRLGLTCQRELGWEVSGSCRSAEKAEALSSAFGLSAHAFDLDESYSGLDDGGLKALADATHVLATLPPIADFDRDPLLALHTKALVDAEKLTWAGYLSTTSVYGDHFGDWVDEEAETRAAKGSAGALRLAAENEWLDLEERTKGRLRPHVFRLAGIYGPGRSALDTVAKATAARSTAAASTASGDAAATPRVVMPRYVSRVHVDDICAAVLASMQQPASSTAGGPRVFNVADDEPAPRGEVMGYAAELLGETLATAADADASGSERPRARRRAAEHKRVSNERMRRLLLPELTYPSYREGLKAIQNSGDD